MNELTSCYLTLKLVRSKYSTSNYLIIENLNEKL